MNNSFIEVTAYGARRLININNIVEFYDSGKQTIISTVNQEEVTVDESYEEIKKVINLMGLSDALSNA